MTETKPFVGLGLLIIGVIAVVCLGTVVWSNVSNSVSGPQASSMMNTSISTGDTMFNMVGVLLIIGACVSVLGMLIYSVSDTRRYQKLGNIYKFLASSLYYFGFGLLAVIIVVVPAFFVWFLWNYTVVEGNTGSFFEIGKWILIIIGIYFGIAALGYIFKKKFVDKYMERKKEIEYQKNMNDLPGATK